jgi:putative flippase GtrA
MINKNVKYILEFKNFIIIGLISTIINYSIYFVFLEFNVFYLYSGIIGFLSGSIFSFYFNRNITFKSKIDPLKGLIIYLIIQIFSLMGHSLFQFTSVFLFEVREVFSQLFGIICSTIINFLSMKFIIFKD